jgi:acyl-CoA thioesterase
MRFSEAMTMTEGGDGRFTVTFDRSWWVVSGPNGGIIVALLVRAAQARLGTQRCVRTVTTHFLAVPTEGSAEIEVSVDRLGRVAGFATVRMVQDGRNIATALVATAEVPSSLHEWEQRRFPDLPALDDTWIMSSESVDVPLHRRWDQRWGLGVPGLPETSTINGGYEAGGWLRLSEPEIYDEAVLAAMSDAWVPAVMVHSGLPVHTPTLELTVHFRTDPRTIDLSADSYCAVVFRQLSGREGFLDESGEIWSPDGQLLVLSRQIGILLPAPDGVTGERKFERL